MKYGEIQIHNDLDAPMSHYPTTLGTPLPQAWQVREPNEVACVDGEGRPVPFGGKVLQRRPDDSVEWLLLDLVTDLSPEEQKVVRVVHQADTVTVEQPVVVETTDDAIALSNGTVHLVLNRRGSIIEHLSIHGRLIVDSTDRVDVETVDPNGRVYRGSVSDGYQLTVEHHTPLRATVRVEGTHAARGGATFLDFVLRFTLYAGRADVQVLHTFVVREPNPGLTEVAAVRFVVPTRMQPDAVKLLRQTHHGREWLPREVAISENIEAASSSVGDINRYRQDYQPYRNGSLFLRNLDSLKEDHAAYPAWIDPEKGTKFRANQGGVGVREILPMLGWRQDDLTLVFAMQWWAQQHPKSVTVDENVLTVHIWPEWATLMRVTQGVNKSHLFWLGAEPRAMSMDEIELAAYHWPIGNEPKVEVNHDPAWVRFCEAGECHHFLAYQPEKYARLEDELRRVVPGEPVRHTYARNGPTGMFNFGDDDTGAWAGFTNNEDDIHVLAPIQYYLRTGNSIAMDYVHQRAAHYMEVDHVMWSSEPRRNGGLIPHTLDHFFGEVYPSHQWSEGILHYYYLTGDERARNVVLRVAENHIWWIDNALNLITADGREAGIPLVNLAAAYRLSRDERLLAAASRLIDAFQRKWFKRFGDLRYPAHRTYGQWQTGYGDYSSYYGLYRIWEVSGDESIRDLLVSLLKVLVTSPERFSSDDARLMDFFAVWAYVELTGDDAVLTTLNDQIENFLIKGGHAMRRLHFLGMLDRRDDPRMQITGSASASNPAAHWHARA